MPKKQLSFIALSGVNIVSEAEAAATTAKRASGRQSLYRFFIILTLIVLLLSACGKQAAAGHLPEVFQESILVNPSIQNTTSTPPSFDVFIGDSVPPALREQVDGLDVRLGVSRFPGQEPQSNEMQIQWVYTLVAPFPTVTDSVTLDELYLAWTEGTVPAAFNGSPLLMEESTLAAFTELWDEPAAGAVRVMPADELLDIAWLETPSWAIIPFESLEPKWKVLSVDGQSPIRKNFDLSSYPLVIPFTMQSSTSLQSLSLSSSNHDPSKLTTVIVTGVTALVRATAYTMELKGTTYPGERIRDLMREADIAHISNEIPFFTGCTFPKPDQGALVFCSDPKYMELLTDIGTDVIELTGNHFADRGAAGMRETIEIYNNNKIPYFGGGVDLQDSLEPALFEVNDNKIAFIGCNKPDVGRFPTATDFQPGAAPCDFEYLPRQINELKAEGYVVISTFQWNESYDSRPSPQQMRDFRLMAESGASIVSGSQAHYAQTMEFHNDAFIHYGLGNLFFDQMGDQEWMPRGIRREFLDRYVIYDGKLISVELITAMLEDYARPRLMTEPERAGFLQEYFYYSGWIPLSATPTPTITPTLTPMSIPTFAGTPHLLPSNTPTP
ncbi:MAG TPA: CapA family protein [Anaerolineales bacterium]|nr:CapA family protein [Anaerolineales bacterium]